MEIPVSNDPGIDSASNTCGAQSTTIPDSVWIPAVGSNPAPFGFEPSSSQTIVQQKTFSSLFKVSDRSFTDVPKSLPPSEALRRARTFIVRRAPFDLKTEEVVTKVSAQLGVAPRSLFESVLRDPKDRRRLYLTFTKLEHKSMVEQRGLVLGDLHIKPNDGYVSGYIPHPPYFVELSTVVAALSPYGAVKDAVFVSTSDGVRIAGLKFSIRPKPGALPPREIRVRGFFCAIRYSDDLRVCSFCKNYGHTIGHCRKKRKSTLHTQDPAPVALENPAPPPANADQPVTDDGRWTDSEKPASWTKVRNRRRRRSRDRDSALAKRRSPAHPDVVISDDDDDDAEMSDATNRTKSPDMMVDRDDESGGEASPDDAGPAGEQRPAEPLEASEPIPPGDLVTFRCEGVTVPAASYSANSVTASRDADTATEDSVSDRSFANDPRPSDHDPDFLLPDDLSKFTSPITPRMARYCKTKLEKCTKTANPQYRMTLRPVKPDDLQSLINIHQNMLLRSFISADGSVAEKERYRYNPLANATAVFRRREAVFHVPVSQSQCSLLRRVGECNIALMSSQFERADDKNPGGWMVLGVRETTKIRNVYTKYFRADRTAVTAPT